MNFERDFDWTVKKTITLTEEDFLDACEKKDADRYEDWRSLVRWLINICSDYYADEVPNEVKNAIAVELQYYYNHIFLKKKRDKYV